MKPKPKSWRGWALYFPGIGKRTAHELACGTLHPTKEQTIEHAEKGYGDSWRYLRKRIGLAVRKVTVREGWTGKEK